MDPIDRGANGSSESSIYFRRTCLAVLPSEAVLGGIGRLEGVPQGDTELPRKPDRGTGGNLARLVRTLDRLMLSQMEHSQVRLFLVAPADPPNPSSTVRSKTLCDFYCRSRLARLNLGLSEIDHPRNASWAVARLSGTIL
jgi:hypothetical protein